MPKILVLLFLLFSVATLNHRVSGDQNVPVGLKVIKQVEAEAEKLADQKSKEQSANSAPVSSAANSKPLVSVGSSAEKPVEKPESPKVPVAVPNEDNGDSNENLDDDSNDDNLDDGNDDSEDENKALLQWVDASPSGIPHEHNPVACDDNGTVYFCRTQIKGQWYSGINWSKGPGNCTVYHDDQVEVGPLVQVLCNPDNASLEWRTKLDDYQCGTVQADRTTDGGLQQVARVESLHEPGQACGLAHNDDGLLYTIMDGDKDKVDEYEVLVLTDFVSDWISSSEMGGNVAQVELATCD